MNIIKTVHEKDQDIIKAILELHIKSDIFQLDPTFSKGIFYKNSKEPPMKFDLYPQRDDVKKSDCTSLPIKNETIESICFDPPFLAGYTKEKKTGTMGKRFGGFRYMKDVWYFYEKSIIEFKRILKKKGMIAFKCQDTISSGKQHWSHVFIINMAEKHGFYVKDLFINVAKNRMIGHNCHNQKHARKYHSYWLVLQKK